MQTANPLIYRPDNDEVPAHDLPQIYSKAVFLNQLEPTPDNPRLAKEDIGEIKASIRSNRMIQPLAARPHPEIEGRYVVFEGCLRLESLQELQQEGHLPNDHQVHILIHDLADGSQDRKLGIIANTLRKPLHPLDEARAWHDVLESGAQAADLAAQVGISLTTIRRRLALNQLCDTAKEMFYAGKLSLSQAQALSMGSPADQEHIIDLMDAYRYATGESILRALFDERPTKRAAAFDLSLYTGSYTRNLFADDDETYFDDVQEFYRLQRAHVQKLREEYKQKGADFVAVAEGYWPDEYKFRTAGGKGDKPKGVAIIMRRGGALEIRERLIPNSYASNSIRELDDAGKPKKPPRPAYGTGICEDINRHKVLAVQRTLLENPRKAKEVAVLQMLTGQHGISGMHPHDALRITAHLAAGKEDAKEVRGVPQSYLDLEAHVEAVTQKVMQGMENFGDKAPTTRLLDNAWYRHDEKLYERLKTLTDDELDLLHLYLPVSAYGQPRYQEIDGTSSVFNRLAKDLGIRMRDFWTPDRYFFSQRTKDQLVDLAHTTGMLKKGDATPAKKADLVNALTLHFEQGGGKTDAWAPGPMHFPAVDDLKPKPDNKTADA